MRIQTCSMLLVALTLGCGGGQRAANDTALGDDGAEMIGETGVIAEVVDHGMAQYCVDRWEYNAEASGDLVAIAKTSLVAEHERWWSPPTRSYVGALDIDDKPSPMIVPPMCGVADVLWGDTWDDAGNSCLVSGYHVQLPEVLDEPSPGAMQFPYSESIVFSTIGNPPQSGRHTWAGEPCCSSIPTPDERAGWWMIPQEEQDQLLLHKDADCRLHVLFKGAHPDAGGFTSPHDQLSRQSRAALTSKCISNHGYYNPVPLAPIKAAGINTWLPWHPTRKQHTTPVNLNYDWVASWGFITSEDFAAFGATIDAVVQALLAVLYLPPNGFEHPRYGGGSACAYHAALKYQVSEWIARVTCPYGYYEVLPDFDQADLGTQIDGIVGHCEIDGYGGLDPLPGAGVDGPVYQVPNAGVPHRYQVADVDRFALMLDAAGRYATEDLADAFEYAIEPGDELAWWSSPGWLNTPGEDMRRTLEYDLADLMSATGWSYDEAKGLADDYGPVPLSNLVEGLPLELQDRRAYTLRAGNIWTLRVERGSYVMFFYFE